MSDIDTQTNRDTWFNHIAAWEQSHKSQKNYCQEVGISFVRFGYWRQQYLKSNLKQPISANKLIDITLSESPKLMTEMIVIKCRNNIELNLPKAMPLSQLLTILEFMGLRHV